MKKLILILIVFHFLQNSYGQVETKFFPSGDALTRVEQIRSHPQPSMIKDLPSFNSQNLINEDRLTEGLDIPFRFGKGFDTEITLADGSWNDVEGGRLWSIGFRSKGAFSINFVFGGFYLPLGAKLYVANSEGTMLYGPVTSQQNTRNGYFMTDLIQGDNVNIYLFEPKSEKARSQLANAENWMFKFQYKMTSCDGSSATTGITYNGADFRAAWNPTDFVLMDMDTSPLGGDQFSWLGWDRSGNTPTSGIGIHHPSGDVMKISFEEGQFQTSSWGGTNNHWLLSLDDGVVEHVSSGSPILDQSRRIVGQLHGNQFYNPLLSYCDQPRAEYGCFHLSWTGGGTNATRLSNWLDPCGTGAVTVNTLRSPYISGPAIVCSSGSLYTIINLPLESPVPR